jgi:hypothetical protein
MKIYNYNHNGEFTGETDANIDPLETELQGEPVYLIPANATTDIIPEVGENQVPVYVDGHWVISVDYRGTVFYDTTTKEKVVIDEVGVEPSSNLTALVPEPLTKWDGEKWVEDLEAYREEQYRLVKEDMITEIEEGYTATVSGTTYKMDGTEEDLSRLRAGYDLATLNEESTMYIVDYFNDVHNNVPTNIVFDIYKEGLSNYQYLWKTKNNLRQEIWEATTVSGIQSIIW